MSYKEEAREHKENCTECDSLVPCVEWWAIVLDGIRAAREAEEKEKK